MNNKEIKEIIKKDKEDLGDCIPLHLLEIVENILERLEKLEIKNEKI